MFGDLQTKRWDHQIAAKQMGRYTVFTLLCISICNVSNFYAYNCSWFQCVQRNFKNMGTRFCFITTQKPRNRIAWTSNRLIKKRLIGINHGTCMKKIIVLTLSMWMYVTLNEEVDTLRSTFRGRLLIAHVKRRCILLLLMKLSNEKMCRKWYRYHQSVVFRRTVWCIHANKTLLNFHFYYWKPPPVSNFTPFCSVSVKNVKNVRDRFYYYY